jgi:hypothetical protein
MSRIGAARPAARPVRDGLRDSRWKTQNRRDGDGQLELVFGAAEQGVGYYRKIQF